MARAVVQVLSTAVATVAALAGALYEDYGLDFLAVGALDGAAVCSDGQRFQAGLVGDVGLAAAEFGQFGDVIAGKAGGLDDTVSSVTAPLSCAILTVKRPGAPPVSAMLELRCSLISGCERTLASSAARPVSCGSA